MRFNVVPSEVVPSETTVMSISHTPELERKLRAHAETEVLSVEAYLERVVRNDEQAERELEGLTCRRPRLMERRANSSRPKGVAQAIHRRPPADRAYREELAK